MHRRYLLIVEDDRAVREMMRFALDRSGFEVGEAADAEAARLSLATRRPDLMLVDWQLPAVSGLDLVRRLRSAPAVQVIPIVMVTGCTAESERVLAFDTGVDDYVTKPFSPRELVARINAVLRRTRRPSNGSPAEPRHLQAVQGSGLVLDPRNRCVRSAVGEVQLGPTDFRLLQFFLTYPDHAHTREQLLDHVWGGSDRAETHTVDVQIRRLRKSLEQLQSERFVQTVRGIGYRFSARC